MPDDDSTSACHIIQNQKVRLAVETANLAGSAFRDVDLSGVTIIDANMKGLSLTDANLQGAHLRDINLKEAVFEDCAIDGLTINGVNIADAFAALAGTTK